MLSKIRPHLNLSNGVLLLALLITGSWVWGTVSAIQQNFALQQKVDSLTQQIAYQEIENQTLVFENQYYSSKEYLELSARRHLNKSNTGEKLVVLPANTVSDTGDLRPSPTPVRQRSNFQQWLFFLFGDKG